LYVFSRARAVPDQHLPRPVGYRAHGRRARCRPPGPPSTSRCGTMPMALV